MYLISQLWWYLSLAFLLGALLGYLLWRMCNQPLIESRFERSRADMVKRLALLEAERHKLVAAGGGAGAGGGDSEISRLKSELASLRQLAEKSTNDFAMARDAETKLKAAASAYEKQINSFKADLDSAKAEAGDNAAREAKKARDTAIAELQAKHTEDVKKMRAEVAAALSAAQSAQQLVAASKAHDSQVLALTDSATAAKRDLDDIKIRHSADVQAAREAAMAELKEKHAQDLKRAREEATAEAAKRHAAEIEQLKRDHEAAVARSKQDLSASQAANNGSAAAHLVAGAGGSGVHAAKGDDLKLIWGIGGALEKTLHDNGVTTFAQIASWSDADIARFEALLLNFKGRIGSEKWVEQAAKLAGGWRPQASGGDKPKGL